MGRRCLSFSAMTVVGREHESLCGALWHATRTLGLCMAEGFVVGAVETCCAEGIEEEKVDGEAPRGARGYP